MELHLNITHHRSNKLPHLSNQRAEFGFDLKNKLKKRSDLCVHGLVWFIWKVEVVQTDACHSLTWDLRGGSSEESKSYFPAGEKFNLYNHFSGTYTTDVMNE